MEQPVKQSAPSRRTMWLCRSGSPSCCSWRPDRSCAVPWVDVRMRGPVSWSERRGAVTIVWNLIQMALSEEPSPTHRPTFRSRRKAANRRWGGRQKRRIGFGGRGGIASIDSSGHRYPTGRSSKMKTVPPGIDVRERWLLLFPGRISATLAIAPVAYAIWRASRTFVRFASSRYVLSCRCERAVCARRADTTCERRPTPSECGWTAPDFEEVAQRLRDVR